MKVLVTGGAGYIGSHTCVELLENGYDVVIADNLFNAREDVIGKIRTITGKSPVFARIDIQDRDALEKLFEEHKIDAVIHFAGYKAVGESVQKPLEYYHNNIYGTIVLLETMRKHGCRKMVFSSSATVYGLNNQVPYTEDMPTSATNPYGWTKVMIEQILRDYGVSDKEFSAVLLRYFNPIGAHKSGLLGDDPNGIPNNLMPYISRVAAGKLPQLNVFGDDYDTVDGTGVRDYIHVIDLAKGHLSALAYADRHAGVEEVNLGTGRGTSVLELVKAFEKASGMKIPYVITPRRAGDIASCYADTRKAKDLLGWTAGMSIDDMCADTWNFAQMNK